MLAPPQVRKHFKPEFVNRIDEFIIFEPLRSDEIRHIVKLRARGVVGRLAERKMKMVRKGEEEGCSGGQPLSHTFFSRLSQL
jgi:ATP-dependent Clp protease ATP-binding subunit ClpA